MSTKTLIVSGDSYAALNIHESTPKPWPSYLAEKAGWNIINVAKGGASNQYIFNTAIDTLEEHKDKDVYVFTLWSDPFRINFFDNACVVLNSLENLFRKVEKSSEKITDAHRQFIENSYSISRTIMKEMLLKYDHDFYLIYDKIINSSLRYMYLFEKYCEHNKIAYSHASSISPFGNHTILDSIFEGNKNSKLSEIEFENGVKRIKKDNYYYKKLLDSSRYMGYEFSASGFVDHHNLNISESDDHPTDLGHQKLSEVFYDYIFHDNKISINTNNYLRPVYIYD